MRVLVTYASAHGSTREIAERIAQRIALRCTEVDCLSVSEVETAEVYDTFVIGSALHGQSWLPEAALFVQNNAAVLDLRRVWLFSVGMPGFVAGPLRKFAMIEGPKAVAPFKDLIHPEAAALFSGVAGRADFPLISRVFVRAMGGHLGDLRDWPEIEGWADAIAGQVCDTP